ncbi:replication restart helicase PriA [Enterobacteriaceae endosymbiont of Donacia semicuprea]|uniref:replication restart helicase PriA n=1 Tax=Enterobacteriaceae endosymbiont of Donacia semicuprea TaxID=2675783 RepID=UPI00144981ED|nr:primosomal protein N' [Enterobacteriaceae endosymbiont of Donacia semicuprea]QJC33039.1 primosomal protein N' [Enterobacteriaceae endosymbiont of Donacia semicuprea]
MKIVKVVFNNSILDHKYDYILPNNIIVNIGYRVIVPIKNKKYIGIVIEIKKTSKVIPNKLKYLYKVLDEKSLFSFFMWNFAKKISKYYQCPIGVILFKILPIFYRKNNRFIINSKNLYLINDKNIYNFKIRLKLLKNKKIVFDNKNNIRLKIYLLWINNIFKIIYYKINFFKTWVLQDNIILFKKIDIYLNLVKVILLHKKQILILAPQKYNILYLYQFFIKLNVSICLLHSNISIKKQLLILENIKKGKILIVIGTKFSIFTQFFKLGLIIIDQENDFVYKQNNKCKYNIRDIAILRAKMENIPIILSSKTLSLETINNININKYKFLFYKNKKISYKKYFKYIIIDINKKILKYKLFSHSLIKMMKIYLKKKEQIIIYYKYIGYSTIILCYFCKKILKCIDCNKNYIFYKKLWKLYCKYCKKNIDMILFCPFCKKNFFIPIGIGSEQLKELLNKLFPNILIFTINSKNFLKTLSLIRNNKPLIIISSQILYKEYFFILKNNLIIFLNIDNVFFSKNFRTMEYFSQYIFNILNNHLDIKKKTVIIQTNYPQNNFLKKIFKQNYTYNEISNYILNERKKMSLPPFTNHITLIIESYKKTILINFLNKLKKILKLKYINEKNFFIIGPTSLIHNKRKGLFRKKIILQHLLKIKLQFIKINIHSIAKKIVNFNKIKLLINVDSIEW